ncbi:hypothetical protein PHMEG_00037446 [Phytophthora megakarya]|uniref:HTH CENPB-type domain-containing protein n=1 Tax=Phytophthora megakarya TaxID=4795 RepID=A0A225UJT0_9STRA|nr:hypothetical protein PHMEG_00037446 [Phytophthora megakarya]
MLFQVLVGEGWYRRFLDRHPELTMRISQSISKVRNVLIDADVRQLFWSLSNVIIEEKKDGSRILTLMKQHCCSP